MPILWLGSHSGSVALFSSSCARDNAACVSEISLTTCRMRPASSTWRAFAVFRCIFAAVTAAIAAPNSLSITSLSRLQVAWRGISKMHLRHRHQEPIPAQSKWPSIGFMVSSISTISAWIRSSLVSMRRKSPQCSGLLVSTPDPSGRPAVAGAHTNPSYAHYRASRFPKHATFQCCKLNKDWHRAQCQLRRRANLR
jgi:hypothetical protein